MTSYAQALSVQMARLSKLTEHLLLFDEAKYHALQKAADDRLASAHFDRTDPEWVAKQREAKAELDRIDVLVNGPLE